MHGTRHKQSEQENALVNYDRACAALAAARSVDEVKDIRSKSVALAAYAKQAKNKELEIDAMAIRLRAERRLGQMIQAQKESVGLAKGAREPGTNRGTTRDSKKPASTLPSLADAGIDKNLAAKARAAAALEERTFKRALSERSKQIRSGSRVMPLAWIAKDLHSRAERQAIADAATAAMPSAVGKRHRLICADMAITEQMMIAP